MRQLPFAPLALALALTCLGCESNPCRQPGGVTGTWTASCGAETVASCGACSGDSNAPYQDQFDIPADVATNGGTFQDSFGNAWALDTSSCTAVPAQTSAYGAGTIGAKCSDSPGTDTIDFTARTLTTFTQCPTDCTICHQSHTCSMSKP